MKRGKKEVSVKKMKEDFARPEREGEEGQPTGKENRRNMEGQRKRDGGGEGQNGLWFEGTSKPIKYCPHLYKLHTYTS